MGYLHQALSAVKQNMGDVDHNGSDEESKWPGNLDERQQRDIDQNKIVLLSTDDLINCMTAPEVITAMTVQVLKKSGISQTSDLPLECVDLKHWPSQVKRTVQSSHIDRPCYEHKVSESSNEWKNIQKHPPCKRMCIDKESNN